MYQWREYVEADGLMSYGSSSRETYRRVAALVDGIFKGASPADPPIARPTTFELLIDLKTATALGVTIPPAVPTRADEIIQ